MGIHLPTLESTNFLSLKLNEAERRWCTKERYTDVSHWETYAENTCYFNDGTYADMDFSLTNGFKILEFSDIDFTKFNSRRQTLKRKIDAITKED